MSSFFSQANGFDDAHRKSDVDNDATAIHHTLGKSYNQAAPGNHKHGETSETLAAIATAIAGVEIDLTGMSKTIKVPARNSLYLVFGVFDAVCSTAGSTFVGRLNVDGVNQTSEAIVTFSNVNERVTVSQHWVVTNLSPGDHIFKLRGFSIGGNWSILGFHTRLTIVRLTD